MRNIGPVSKQNPAADKQIGTVAYFTVATAGHVDHGKTSLLKALSGIDADRLKEEKERQMTTDLGYAHLFLTPTLGLGFIDVPGHGKFLKNMLAGVGGIDLALLVVAANEGPMPQTKQHLEILKYLGVEQIIVVVTKCDLVSAADIDSTIKNVSELLATHNLKAVSFVPVSCLSGKGIDCLKDCLQNSLLQLPQRSDAGSAFLPIDRAFKKDGFGVVITGTLVKGKLQVGDQILIQPGAHKARIRRLETFGRQVDSAVSGQRLAVNLVLKEDRALTRGQVVLSSDMMPAKTLVVSLCLAGDGEIPKRLPKLVGYPVQLFHGTAACHGQINWIEQIADSKNSSDLCQIIAQISLDEPVVSQVQDRFVVRFSNDTVGGGKILLQDRPRWLTRSKLTQLAPLLLQGEFKQALLCYLQSCPQKMLRVDQATHFIPQSLIDDILAGELVAKTLVTVEGWIISSTQKCILEESIMQGLKSQMLRSLQDVPEAEARVPMEHLRAKVMRHVNRQVFQDLLKNLVATNAIERHGDSLSLPGYKQPSNNSSELAELAVAILKILEQVPCLEIDALSSQCQTSASQIKTALKLLVADKKAALVGIDFAASQTSLDKAYLILVQLWQQKHEINPGDFRQGLGTTRKYAVALLEYFDNSKITRRLPTGRVLLRAP